MPTKLRVASFNVENLFARAKVLNFRNTADGTAILKKIAAFQGLLEKTTYTPAIKTKIKTQYNALKDYIEVREDRGKLFKRQGWAVVGVHPKTNGAADWDGAIEFKQERFSEMARENTARVIKDVKADVACIVEADNRPVLNDFDGHLLNDRYPFNMLVDGNDNRGIDVGVLSKHPVGRVTTHIFDKHGRSRIFSRDCLEVEVLLPDGRTLHVLCNHFKSKLNNDTTADDRRKLQAATVAKILGKYNLQTDLVVVAGDFNDTPVRPVLRPLLDVPHLHDVLELQFPADPKKRWTYFFNGFDQIDYVLVSRPLKDAFVKAGVERRGIFGLKQLTENATGVDPEESYDTVTGPTNAASDHGAVWAEFSI